MSKLFACMISDDVKHRRETLVAIAHKFAHSIEVLDDGILFDVSGLERLIGTPDKVAQHIFLELKRHKIQGNVAVAETVDTAMLLARCTSPHVSKGGTRNAEPANDDGDALDVPPLFTCGLAQQDMFSQLPLRDLNIEQGTLNVFEDLGLRRVEDLLAIPQNELVSRYGRSFQDVIDTIEQKGTSFLVPNVKENNVEWSFDLNNAVENFEQLVFVLNHGLERLFEQVEHAGSSCEHLDLLFKLKNRTTKAHEIKTSFPTLDRNFWLKLINLRVALDPPEADIIAVNVVAHFTPPRTAQKGLYAVSRPEPESLLLTVNKLKKLVGEKNVGVPVLLDQRLAEPFAMETDAMPLGKEKIETIERKPIIAFYYFRPPIRAEVLVRERQLMFIKTRDFAAHILNCSGVWKANSKWWDKPWKTSEWDIEVENNGVYRLCKAGEEWLLVGEYD